MTDPALKPLASLSSSLLARKGHAAPAMRRQAFSSHEHGLEALEDLGWNDHGHEEGEQLPAPLEQQAALGRQFAAPSVELSSAPQMAEHREPVKRAAPGSRGKSAFTLRLDGERHLKLRLVCAMKHRSAQQIVTEALDAFLDKQPGVTDLQRNAR
jgi:hypothetical protein